MRSLPNFSRELCDFVQEEARKQSSAVFEEKDSPLSSFNIESVRKYSYKQELDKFERSNPLLLAAIVGSISKEKVDNYSDISRKGFGGSNSSENIDLIPCVVQTVSRILKNRHPRSVITTPCMNSLYLWSNRVSGHILHFFNSLGDSYRYFLTFINFGFKQPFISQAVTNDIVDQVVDGHAVDILAMKDRIEQMYATTSTKRARWTISAFDTPGYCLFGDNVGKFSKL